MAGGSPASQLLHRRTKCEAPDCSTIALYGVRLLKPEPGGAQPPGKLCGPHRDTVELTFRPQEPQFRLLTQDELFPDAPPAPRQSNGVHIPAEPEQVPGLPPLESVCVECSGFGRHSTRPCRRCGGHGLELTEYGSRAARIVGRHTRPGS